ncbi:serine carboxypeptidase-like enzyme [Selaginella moellendorffii]|uniref:Carboxypeptidase n=1 Tax=Selaginella moellendorffii TaxID=88036 RepID=D8SGB0_SELML|nr:serine carboxypeptidase-like 50 [Selaginella moellendorffii]EFJ16657.1 serine carboxypeptidase-like enzyme [Selaginella moellendorffii]|eukprot:XP_002982412.1 serine carboxypeptidase-like 50 [Selaginella moellendorffii]
MISALAVILAAVAGGAFYPFKFLHDQVSSPFPTEALPTISGYFPLDRSSKMFFAYYEAIEPAEALASTPIILWLQGGPGCSSMTGNFYEFGPWRTAPDLQLHRNEAPWNHRFGVVFIDNPLGTGYSIAEKDDDIPVNQDEVARDLHQALLQFFKLDPSFKNRPFFIAGESYAGKYVPALGHYLVKLSKNSSKNSSFRLDGLMIGNGLTHPITQVQTHAATAYSFGLLDAAQRSHAEDRAKVVVASIEREDWQGAYESRTQYMEWIENVTGLATVLDVRRSVPYHCSEDGTEFLALFLNRQEVKAALKADDAAQWISCNPRVRTIMANDTMKSVKWMVEELLLEIPILIYQGQYDIKDGVVASEDWMRQLEWEHREKFFAAEKKIWKVGKSFAGYWRSYGTLTHVVVSGAGHLVPADQGVNSQQMVEKWIRSALQVKDK